MEALIITFGIGLAYWLGHKIGRKEGRKQVIDALGVPDGYVIDSVHYRKIGGRGE